MEQLRIKKKDLYEIEVNDEGETIVFDLTDIGLPLKLAKAFDDIEELRKQYKIKELAISKKPYSKKKTGVFSEKDMEHLKLMQATFDKMRQAMDGFLGEGSCQKIFGDSNYFEMYEELFEALAPHIEKMGMRMDDIKQRIAAKYAKKSENVLK